MAKWNDRGIQFPVRVGLEMLPARLVPERAMSDEEFQQFCFTNDAVQIERGSDGIIHLYPMNAAVTGDANSEITGQLRTWSNRNNVGKAVGSSVGYFLPDGSMLCPNAAFVSNTKWQAMTQEELKGIPRFAPDFVIELVSDWKTLDRLRRKMPLWFTNGVLLGWLVDPDVRAVTIYRPWEEPVTVSGDWLDGDGPVAGLRFNLPEIWRCYEL
jgi:Uma2 family endonuclease